MTNEERERARLSRRERDIPIPSPDNVDALAATLADWGAEHRPHDPCLACGCTLYWTATGSDMCAICLPMPRISDQTRERIATMFPRRRPGAISQPTRGTARFHPSASGGSSARRGHCGEASVADQVLDLLQQSAEYSALNRIVDRSAGGYHRQE
jgi:hypothetical protein